jgi:hypothetical protein
VASAEYAGAATSRNNRRGVAASVICGPFRGSVPRPTEFSSLSECSAVEGSIVE